MESGGEAHSSQDPGKVSDAATAGTKKPQSPKEKASETKKATGKSKESFEQVQSEDRQNTPSKHELDEFEYDENWEHEYEDMEELEDQNYRSRNKQQQHRWNPRGRGQRGNWVPRGFSGRGRGNFVSQNFRQNSARSRFSVNDEFEDDDDLPPPRRFTNLQVKLQNGKRFAKPDGRPLVISDRGRSGFPSPERRTREQMSPPGRYNKRVRLDEDQFSNGRHAERDDGDWRRSLKDDEVVHESRRSRFDEDIDSERRASRLSRLSFNRSDDHSVDCRELLISKKLQRAHDAHDFEPDLREKINRRGSRERPIRFDGASRLQPDREDSRRGRRDEDTSFRNSEMWEDGPSNRRSSHQHGKREEDFTSPSRRSGRQFDRQTGYPESVDRARDRAREKARERERERELEREAEVEREREERQRKLDREREIERERKRELEREREMIERQREQERQRELERERERELERQREVERQREAERQRDAERQRELERQRVVERQRELERQREVERQRELERQREVERQRELERERERLERERELERQREVERKREKEIQRDPKLDRERTKERERERERGRGRDFERVRGMERIYDLVHMREAEREREKEKERRERERTRDKEREKERLMNEERNMLREREREREEMKERERSGGRKERAAEDEWRERRDPPRDVKANSAMPPRPDTRSRSPRRSFGGSKPEEDWHRNRYTEAGREGPDRRRDFGVPPASAEPWKNGKQQMNVKEWSGGGSGGGAANNAVDPRFHGVSPAVGSLDLPAAGKIHSIDRIAGGGVGGPGKWTGDDGPSQEEGGFWHRRTTLEQHRDYKDRTLEPFGAREIPSQPNDEPNEVIFILGLSPDVTELEIRHDIRDCDLWPSDVRLLVDGAGKSQGIMVVTFNSKDEAYSWMSFRKGKFVLRNGNYAPMIYKSSSYDWMCVRCDIPNYKSHPTCCSCKRIREECLDGFEEASPYPTTALILRNVNPKTSQATVINTLKCYMQNLRLERIQVGPRCLCFLELTSVVDALKLYTRLVGNALMIEKRQVVVSYARLECLPPMTDVRFDQHFTPVPLMNSLYAGPPQRSAMPMVHSSNPLEGRPIIERGPLLHRPPIIEHGPVLNRGPRMHSGGL